MRCLLPVVLLLLGACGANEPTPEGLLDRDTFKELLLQAHLIEARVSHELLVEHRSEVPTERYYKELFEEQGVSEEEFTTTYRHYLARPEEMKAIFEEIITELTFRKDSFEPLQSQEPPEPVR